MLRCYVLINKYVSGIQIGIQAAHAVASLVAGGHDKAIEWAKFDRTLIFLDASAEDIDEACDLAEYHDIPYDFFEEGGMNNLVTAAAFVVDDVTDVDFHLYTQNFKKKY